MTRVIYDGLDFTGYWNGQLTVIQKANTGRTKWVCKCDCGNTVIYTPHYFKQYKSCGCLEKENKYNLFKYVTTHNKTNTRLYHIWQDIKYRCYNSKAEHYDRYGGRGITMCDEWKTNFMAFYEWSTSHGYDDVLTIERKDVNGNYEPANCTWVDKVEQANNRTNTIWIFDDYTQENISLSNASHKYGIPDYYIKRRLNRGYSLKQAVEDWKRYKNKDNFMTLPEASKYYGVCDGTIRNWISSGKLVAEVWESRFYIPCGQNIC